MNSALQLINEAKTSKIVIVYCLAGYNFNHTFISHTSMQICWIIYPPVTAVFCFLSYILSTVPMVIKLYSESKTSVWRREGGEQCFFRLTCPAVASSSLLEFCLGLDKQIAIDDLVFWKLC